MTARDRLLPILARALFALPPRAIAALAGSPPPHAAGLEPDAWLLARLAARGAVPVGSLPVDELRARFARQLAGVAIRPRLPLSARDVTGAGAARRLRRGAYIPAA